MLGFARVEIGQLRLARELVQRLRRARLVARLALAADEVLEVLDDVEEQAAQLVELGVGGLRGRQWILVGLDGGIELADRLLGLAAQRLCLREQRLRLLDLLLLRFGLRLRAAAGARAGGLELLLLLGDLRELLGDQILDAAHARDVRGERFLRRRCAIGFFGALGREQVNELLLCLAREIDRLLEIREPLDRLAQCNQRIALGHLRLGQLLRGQRGVRAIHRGARIGDERQRIDVHLQQLLLLGLELRVVRVLARGLHARAHFLDAVAQAALAIAEHARLHPRRDQRCRLGRAAGELAALDLRDRGGLLEQRHLVTGDLAQHVDRLEQLLAGALERLERGLAARDGILGREVLQLATRLGDPRARFEDVDVEVLELDHARLLLGRALVLGLLADRVDLVVGDVADRADLRDDAAFLIGELRQRALLRERVGAAGLLDLHPRAARALEDLALVADRLVEARLELALVAAQLVGHRLRARTHGREVCLRVAVLLQLHGIGEPRHGLLLELERLREVTVLVLLHLVGVRGVRHAEVVGGAIAQLGIDAGVAARLEQRLLRAVVVAVLQQRDSFVVLHARVAMLTTRARGDEREDQELVHAPLRSGEEPTASAASRNTSDASTSHGNRSAGISRYARSAAARTIGRTCDSMIESRSIALVPAGM